MTELKRWIYRLCILMKQQLRMASFWMTAVLLFILLLFLGQMALPTAANRAIGLTADGDFASAVAQDLLSSDSAYTWKTFESKSSLTDAVTTGEVDSGFVLDTRLDEALSAAEPQEGAITVPDFNDLIGYIRSTTTTKGEAVKEEVYAALLRQASPVILKNAVASGILLTDHDEAAQEAVLKEMEQVIAEDAVFQVRFEVFGGETETGEAPEETVNAAEEGSRNTVVFALTGILLFAAALLFAAVHFRPETQSLTAWFRGRGIVWEIGEVLAPLILVSVMPSVYLLIARLSGPLQILLLFVLLPAVSAWSVLLVRLFRHEAVYLFLAAALIAAAVLFSFSGDLPFFRTVRWLRLLLPSTWMTALLS